MKIQINASEVAKMSEMSATDRVYFLQAKFYSERSALWVGLGPGVKKIQDEMVTGRA
jgi:hypothetical protein